MKTLTAVIRNEFRMQVRRPVLWVALFATSALALGESFPSAANLQRLTYLTLSAYAAHRTFFVSVPVLAIVAGILAADRLPLDRRTGMNALLWTSPRLSPLAYGLGKLLGSACAFSLVPLTLGLEGILVRAIFFSQAFEPGVYLKATLVMGLLPLFFITVLAMTCGAVLGVRVSGSLLALYILWSNLFWTGDSQTGVTQSYRFLGNLDSLVFVVPGWPHVQARIAAGWQTLGIQAGLACLAMIAMIGLCTWNRREVKE